MECHGNDQQQQHRAVGDGPEDDAIEQRRDRQYQQQRHGEAYGKRRLQRNEQPHDQRNCCRNDEIIEEGVRDLAIRLFAHQRSHLDQGRKAGERHQKADCAGNLSGVQSGQCQSGESGDISKGNEDDARNREDENRTDRNQNVDGTSRNAIYA